jgi:hypothetical protein
MRKQGRYLDPRPLLNLFPGEGFDGIIASLCGVARTTVVRWRRNPNALIWEYDADRYAIAMGMHPSEIWLDWFDIENEEAS